MNNFTFSPNLISVPLPQISSRSGLRILVKENSLFTDRISHNNHIKIPSPSSKFLVQLHNSQLYFLNEAYENAKPRVYVSFD